MRIALWVCIMIILWYFIAIFIIHDFDKNFILIDKCLDEWNVWNYETQKCIR